MDQMSTVQLQENISFTPGKNSRACGCIDASLLLLGRNEGGLPCWCILYTSRPSGCMPIGHVGQSGRAEMLQREVAVSECMSSWYVE